jgi:hypothetical protein
MSTKADIDSGGRVRVEEFASSNGGEKDKRERGREKWRLQWPWVW